MSIRKGADSLFRTGSCVSEALRRLLYGLLISLLIPWQVFAAPPANIADSSPITVRVQTPVYHLDTSGVSVPLGATGVSVAGYTWNDQPGAPRLPVYGTLIELPATGDWELSHASAAAQTLDLPADIPAVPVPRLSMVRPEGWTVSADLPETVPVFDEPDAAIYAADIYYPASPVVIGDEQWQRGHRYLAVRVFPFQYNPVKRQLLHNPDITITVTVTGSEAIHQLDEYGRTPESQATEGAAGVTAELGALRITTTDDGMHRLTYDDLFDAGLPVATLDPATFYMTNRGSPVSIQVTGASDGHFDPGDLVIFYAEPYTGRWMTSNVYRFVYQTTPAPPSTRMLTRTVTKSGLEPVVTTITQTQHIELNSVYYSDYGWPTDADHFLDNLHPSQVYPNNRPTVERAHDLAAFDDLVATGDSFRLTALLYGGMAQAPNPDQSVEIWLNSHLAGTVKWEGRVPYTARLDLPVNWLDSSPNGLKLVAALSQIPGVMEYAVNPDWLDLSYPALADAEDDRIHIEEFDTEAFAPTTTSVELRVTGFTTDTVHVYDARNPAAPVEIMQKQTVNAGPPYELRFWDAWAAGSPASSYYLTTDAALIAPIEIKVEQSVHLRDPSRTADYIAIVHRSLWGAIQPLLDRRAAEGLRVTKVDVQDIYDEFNNGLLHPNAIRDFLEYAYHNWNAGEAPPKYVLLVGDGHVDFKNALNLTSLPNLIPPFLIDIDPYIHETAADNRFVTFDGPADYLPEMAIGRIPARDEADVQAVLAKIAAYEDTAATPGGAWQSTVYYVADSNTDPAGHFHDLTNLSRNMLPAAYDDRGIYYGTPGLLDGSAMNTAIRAAFDNGGVMLQWFGHASKFRWGSVSMFNVTHLPYPNLADNSKLPFTAAYSCWSGYFINTQMTIEGQSLGEALLLEPGRGSIADLSPSGLHIGSALVTLNQGLTKAIFLDNVRVVGEAVNTAKLYYQANSSYDKDVIDTSILFGDPALKLRLPSAPTVSAANGTPGAITLSWRHSAWNDSYTVWRSTVPYFDPPTQGVGVGTIDAAGHAAGEVVQFADDGTNPPPAAIVNGDPSSNYFWIVRTSSGLGFSPDSNPVGEFDFALVNGS